MNIVFLDTLTLGEGVDIPGKLAPLGEVQLYKNTSRAECPGRIKDAEIVIVNKVLMDAEMIDQAPKLKLICLAATGMNNIDLLHAEKKGISVMNVAGYSTESVTQTTFTALLYLLNQPTYYDQYVKKGFYSKQELFTHIGPSFEEIDGKQLGIIGLGTIGKRVATIAEAFGATIVYHSASGNLQDVSYQHLPLNKLMETSDILSIHAPLNGYTENLIKYEELNLMKPNSILINMGRGGIVNETDFAKSFDQGKPWKAAFDVFTQEPIPHDHPFLKINRPDDLLLLPHVAWGSFEARNRLMDRICENIQTFFDYGNTESINDL